MELAKLHEKTWETLHTRRKNLPHALLICARPGMGAFELIHEFAANLLCENEPKNQNPELLPTRCTTCPACHWFDQKNHPDFHLIQPAFLAQDNTSKVKGGTSNSTTEPANQTQKSKQIVIDQIRKLNELSSVGTHRKGLRVILIYPTESMNRNAANALLKILEEPPKDTCFLLVTHNQNSVLPTIRSRTQIVSVPTPERATAFHYLESLGVQKAESWLSLAGGAPLNAAEMAINGQPPWVKLLFEQLMQEDSSSVFSIAAKIDTELKKKKQGDALQQVLTWTQKWIIDLSLAKAEQPPRYFTKHANYLEPLCLKTSRINLIHFFRRLNAMHNEAEQPLNARLFLEDLLLSYQHLFQSPEKLG